MAIKLTDEQRDSADQVLAYFDQPTKPYLTFGGLAGVGKTTLVKRIRYSLRKYRNPAVCALTGKAVDVLRKKGVHGAVTLHRLIYRPVEDKNGRVKFVKKENIGADAVIVDEASMISQDLLDDLTSYGVPILFVGDIGQLEPVGDDPYLMRDPDVLLTTVHRQAAESQIIQFSMALRQGTAPRDYPADGKEVQTTDYDDFIEKVMEYEQIICGYNRTRSMLDNAIRSVLGLEGPLPVFGDRITVMKNNYTWGVFNGQTFSVLDVTKQPNSEGVMEIVAVDELDQKYRLPVVAAQFGHKSGLVEGKHEKVLPEPVYADWAFAITCHRSQGSEWNSVAVYEEINHSLWDPRRWRYTAVTRARSNLLYCL